MKFYFSFFFFLMGLCLTLNLQAQSTNLVFEFRNNVVPSCGTADGKINVVILGGTPDFTITWSGADMGEKTISGHWLTLQNLPSSIYNVTVTDGTGNSASKSIDLSNDSDCGGSTACDDFRIELRNNALVSCDENDGKIDVVIRGGSPTYTIQWSNGGVRSTERINGQWFTIKGLAEGDYDVTVTDGEGCSEQQSIRLDKEDCSTSCDDFSIELRNNAPVSCNENDGTINVAIRGGSPTYTIQWSNGGVISTERIDGHWFTITGLAEGNYGVTVADEGGCTDEKSITLNLQQHSFTSTSTSYGAAPECDEDNAEALIEFSVGASPVTIEWESTNGDSGLVEVTTNSYLLQNLGSGEYFLTLTDANDCAFPNVIEFTVPEPDNCEDCGDFSFDVEAQNPICADSGSIQVEIGGGIPPYIVQRWGVQSSRDTISNDTIFSKELPLGYYSFRITDALDCELRTSVVVENTGLEFLVETSQEVDCGNDNGEIIVTVQKGQAPYNIQWEGGGLSGSTTTNSMNYNLAGATLSVGTYSVTLTDATGCSLVRTTTVSEREFRLSASLVKPTNCGTINGSLRLFVSKRQAPVLLEWEGPVSGMRDTRTNAPFYIDIEDLPFGVYTLTATDGLGCVEEEVFDFKTAEACGECLGLSSTILEYNDCDEVVLGIGGDSPPYTIAWEGNEMQFSEETNDCFFTFSELQQGAYQYTITDANECTLTRSFYVEANCCDLETEIRNIKKTDCNGTNGSFEVEILNGSGEYGYGLSSTGSIFRLEGNTFYFEVQSEGYVFLDIYDSNTDCYTKVFVYLTPDYEVCNCGQLDVDIVASNLNTVGYRNGQIGLDIDGINTGGVTVEIFRRLPYLPMEGVRDLSKLFLQDQYRFVANSSTMQYVIDGLTAGEYYVKITDSAGCITGGKTTIEAVCQEDNGGFNSEDTSYLLNNNGIQKIEIFPNPSTGVFHLNIQLPELADTQIQVFNTIGQLVAEYEYAETEHINQSLDLSNQEAGIYFLKIQSAGHTQVEQLVLVQ